MFNCAVVTHKLEIFTVAILPQGKKIYAKFQVTFSNVPAERSHIQTRHNTLSRFPLKETKR